MTTIYVLTEGDYSDYHIVALYSTHELAEDAQKLCPNSNVEEYEVDSLKIPEHPPGYTGWNVSINADTNDIHSSYQQDILQGHFKPQENYCDNSKWPTLPSLFVVNCWARDKEHAEKIALDKYYQFKAQQIMGTRHLIAVQLDGDYKIAQYGQWDGYLDDPFHEES